MLQAKEIVANEREKLAVDGDIENSSEKTVINDCGKYKIAKVTILPINMLKKIRVYSLVPNSIYGIDDISFSSLCSVYAPFINNSNIL